VKIIRHIHARAALIVLAAVAVVGGGVAYAATRTTTTSRTGTGVVVIETSLAYQRASAAGTGMVLTPSGEVLTNNHVIAGATTIRVLVPGAGRAYQARVVGYDTSADVAVLQLRNASGLTTVKTGDASRLGVGDHVTAIGNAGGTGSLTSASGTVTALNQAITVQDEDRSAERLSGLIETDAPLQPGDSGGPLLDDADRVVGMDTAASSRFAFTAFSPSQGYAIPIGTALGIADRIVSGRSSGTTHVGDTALLGVQVSDTASSPFGFGDVPAATDGATVTGVVADGPADAAGLASGDVITALDGQAVTSAGDIQRIVLAHQPGAKVTISYVDTSGASHTGTVTLASGPPQ
jgi:S1-C subfamily serine protease